MEPQVIQNVIYVIVLAVAGIAEYLHLAPAGTVFFPTMTLVLGHMFGTTLSPNAYTPPVGHVVVPQEMVRQVTNGATTTTGIQSQAPNNPQQ